MFIQKLKSTKEIEIMIAGLEELVIWGTQNTKHNAVPPEVRILLMRNNIFTVKQAACDLWQDCNAGK